MRDASSVSDPYCIVAPARASPEERRAMIREAAYYRAQQRGFAPGHELEDWLLAEREFDALRGGGAKNR
jgi:hypothetical protein